ncbi:MAG: tetratricopeptide repeat protein [Turicibacter sp.]
MSIQHFIDQYQKGQITEDLFEEMQHYAFNANDEEIFILAQLFCALGRASQAVELVEPLVEKYPDELNLKTFLADLYLDLAEDEKVLHLLSNDNEDQSNVSLLLLEADMYITQGLFEVAEQKIKKALELEPKNDLIKLAYAEFYHHIGEFDQALNLYLDLVDYSLSAEINVYERLATCYSHTGEFEKALEQFDLSEKFFGTLSIDQLFNKGFLAYRLEQPEKAKEIFNQIKELDPSYDSIYPLLAQINLKQKDYEKTLEIVGEGLSFNEYNPELYFVKATALEKIKDFEAARDAYYEVLNLDPEDLVAARKANQMCFILEDFEEVIANIHHYEESGLVDEKFQWDLAVAHLELEDYEEAKLNFELANVYYQNDIDFLYDYSQFLLEEGLAEEAKKMLQKIVSLDSSAMQAKELLENLM